MQTDILFFDGTTMNTIDNPLLVKRPLPDLLTIVIPMYNEEEVIPVLKERLEV